MPNTRPSELFPHPSIYYYSNEISELPVPRLSTEILTKRLGHQIPQLLGDVVVLTRQGRQGRTMPDESSLVRRFLGKSHIAGIPGIRESQLVFPDDGRYGIIPGSDPHITVGHFRLRGPLELNEEGPKRNQARMDDISNLRESDWLRSLLDEHDLGADVLSVFLRNIAGFYLGFRLPNRLSYDNQQHPWLA